VLVSIPRELRGASLGAAHAWVREQMAYSNPRRTMGDYTLRDSSGKRVSLSALVKGELSEVDIVGADELDAVRANPAHPMSLMSTSPLPAIMYQQNLPRVFGGVITPALWTRTKEEYGLFGAAQRLSILLSRPSPLEGHNNYSPRTLALLDARLGTSEQPMHRFVRSNPTSNEVRQAVDSLGLGSYSRATNVMNRTNMLGAESTRNIELVRRLVDDFLDVAETKLPGEQEGRLISMAQKMSLQFENSKALFDNFAKNVLAPYLIGSTANVYALEYINEYILPASRLIIENTGKSNRDVLLRKLDSYYKHLVKSLATSPGDFYAGKEMALIAHPAFLFKRAGLVLLPVPRSRKDRGFYAMPEVGTPLTYTESGFVVRSSMPKAMNPIVRVLGKDELRQMRSPLKDFKREGGIGTATYLTKATLDTIYKAVDSLRESVELSGPGETSAYNLLVSETRRMGQKKIEELYKDIEGMPAFFYMDLPGIRPIPTNWPQPLIYAMMEVLASYRDRLTGLRKEGSFDTAEFLTPSGIHLDIVSSDRASEVVVLENAIGKYTENDKKENADAVLKAARALGEKYGYAAGLTAASVKVGSNVKESKKNATSVIVALDQWLEVLRSKGVLGGLEAAKVATKDYGDTPSIYKIVVEMVERSITYYNYEPTRDEVWFTITLLYYSLRHMGLDSEMSMSFFGSLTKVVREAREAGFGEWLGQVQEFAAAPADAEALNEDFLAKYVALKTFRKALDDPKSKEFLALFGERGTKMLMKKDGDVVRANPGTFSASELEKTKTTLDESIKAYELAMSQKYKGSAAAQSLAYLQELFNKELLKVAAAAEQPLATYVGGDIETSTGNAEAHMDKLYQGMKDNLEKTFEAAKKLSSSMEPDKSMQDVHDALVTFNHSLEMVDMILEQEQSLGGFLEFIPTSEYSSLAKKARKLTDFFRLVRADFTEIGLGEGSESIFATELKDMKALGKDLSKLTGDKYYFPSRLNSNLTDFLLSIKDVVDATTSTTLPPLFKDALIAVTRAKYSALGWEYSEMFERALEKAAKLAKMSPDEFKSIVDVTDYDDKIRDVYSDVSTQSELLGAVFRQDPYVGPREMLRLKGTLVTTIRRDLTEEYLRVASDSKREARKEKRGDIAKLLLETAPKKGLGAAKAAAKAPFQAIGAAAGAVAGGFTVGFGAYNVAVQEVLDLTFRSIQRSASLTTDVIEQHKWFQKAMTLGIGHVATVAIAAGLGAGAGLGILGALTAAQAAATVEVAQSGLMRSVEGREERKDEEARRDIVRKSDLFETESLDLFLAEVEADIAKFEAQAQSDQYVASLLSLEEVKVENELIVELLEGRKLEAELRERMRSEELAEAEHAFLQAELNKQTAENDARTLELEAIIEKIQQEMAKEIAQSELEQARLSTATDMANLYNRFEAQYEIVVRDMRKLFDAYGGKTRFLEGHCSPAAKDKYHRLNLERLTILEKMRGLRPEGRDPVDTDFPRDPPAWEQ